MISATEACLLVLNRSGEKYISGITEFEDKYDIGIAYEDGEVPTGFWYCVNKITGEVGTVGSYEMFKPYNGETIEHSVPQEYRCPNFKHYDE